MNNLAELIEERRTGRLHVLRSDEERRQKEEERRRREGELLRQWKEERRRREEAFVQRARAAFETNYLGADETLAADPDRALLSPDEYRQLKVDFVREWSSRELGRPLDNQQATAVALAAGNTLVVARAGCGKTTTLTARAIFLQKHCGINPRELLLLAFNNEAANEISKRLRQVLGGSLHHVMTFHQLAYAITQPTADILADRRHEGNFALSKFVQQIIDDFIKSGQYADRIKLLMMTYFKEHWDMLVQEKNLIYPPHISWNIVDRWSEKHLQVSLSNPMAQR